MAFRTWKKVARFLRDEEGPTAVEYAMMIMLIFLACIMAVVSVGQSTSASFQHSGAEITEAFKGVQ